MGAISKTVRPSAPITFQVTSDEVRLTINFQAPIFYTNGDSLGDVTYEIRKDGELLQITSETEYTIDFDGAAEIYDVVAVDDFEVHGIPVRSAHIWRGNYPDVLIWDPSISEDGIAIANFMEILERKVATIDNPARYPLANFPVVFITLGMFPYNQILLPEQSSLFMPIFENGGSIYMEGGDTWYDDSQTELNYNFGLYGNETGEGDLWLVQGKDSTFTEGMEFVYESESQFVDRLIPYQSGFAILENITPNYVCAVANETENFRTVGSSAIIAGIAEPMNYLDKILDFLWYMDEPCPDWIEGDLNQDDDANILDIVITINIILNNVMPGDCQFWAADLNDDESIDILDIVLFINLILSG